MRSAPRVALLAASLLAASATLAGDADPRGWTSGTVAASAKAALAGPELAPLELPSALRKQIHGPTLIVYFSPTCPHCRDVAPELHRLSQLAQLREELAILGVASGSASASAAQEFRTDHGWTFPVLHDADREMAAALGARSTPSAVLVKPARAGMVEVIDRWYPYRPGTDALVQGRILGNLLAPALRGAYLGNVYCGACHTEEHASWSLSHHAVAWQTLRRMERTTDDACTSCHVTGAGQAGGWSGAAHSPLVDVGCEACHGPSGPHDGQPTEPKGTCEGCHDAKHAIAFSYDKGLPLLDHHRINALSPAEIEQRRQQLWRGRAPRDLLAFAEGETVGAAACQRCHPAEYDAWAQRPHARAMGSLRKEGHDDPACVRCHATGTSMPAGSSVGDFRTFEGVGCESCHGPGKAHVEAEGGSHNIEGLGEDCPVCVLEALCTGCHTQTWDPEWRLETRLDAIRH
ncbi:MAG: redoxin domain-containing protein [Myxococcales bacterium]|nr:redoxin domain-containing protein [Myxococcales bacterium]